MHQVGAQKARGPCHKAIHGSNSKQNRCRIKLFLQLSILAKLKTPFARPGALDFRTRLGNNSSVVCREEIVLEANDFHVRRSGTLILKSASWKESSTATGIMSRRSRSWAITTLSAAGTSIALGSINNCLGSNLAIRSFSTIWLAAIP